MQFSFVAGMWINPLSWIKINTDFNLGKQHPEGSGKHVASGSLLQVSMELILPKVAKI